MSESNTLRAAMHAGDFDLLEQALADAYAAYRQQPGRQTCDQISRLYRQLTEAAQDQDLAAVEAWLASRPDSGWAHAVAGLLHTDIARETRGASTSGGVSEQDWAQIRKHYDLAEPLLRRSMALGVPAGRQLEALMQRQQVIGQQTEAERLFGELREVDPQWYGGWRTMQAIKEPRWGGSVPEMQALLDEARSGLQDPQSVTDLEASHHWWVGSYAYSFREDSEQALQHYQQALSFAATPPVVGQIHHYRALALRDLDRLAEATDAWRAAVAADPDAEYFYELARSLVKQEKLDEAEQFFRVAIDKGGTYGYWSARYLAYDLGQGDDGFRCDPLEAIRLYEVANQLARGTAQQIPCLVATAYLLRSTEAHGDRPRAAELFRQAYGLGDLRAMVILGDMQREAEIEGGATAAFESYQLAAEQEDSLAQERLGFCLLEGQGCEPSIEAGRHWLEKAGMQGSQAALRWLVQDAFSRGDRTRTEILLWQACSKQDAYMAGYTLARGLIEGWFGAPDLTRADEVLSLFLTQHDHADSKILTAITRYPHYRGGWDTIKPALKALKSWQGNDARMDLATKYVLRQLPGSYFGYLLWARPEKLTPPPPPPDMWCGG